MAGDVFEHCPGGLGHMGPAAWKLECRACLIPSRDDLTAVLDSILVQEGIALPRGKITQMAQQVRAYFAGRYGLPLEAVQEPEP